MHKSSPASHSDHGHRGFAGSSVGGGGADLGGTWSVFFTRFGGKPLASNTFSRWCNSCGLVEGSQIRCARSLMLLSPPCVFIRTMPTNDSSPCIIITAYTLALKSPRTRSTSFWGHHTPPPAAQHRTFQPLPHFPPHSLEHTLPQ